MVCWRWVLQKNSIAFTFLPSLPSFPSPSRKEKYRRNCQVFLSTQSPGGKKSFWSFVTLHSSVENTTGQLTFSVEEEGESKIFFNIRIDNSFLKRGVNKLKDRESKKFSCRFFSRNMVSFHLKSIDPRLKFFLRVVWLCCNNRNHLGNFQ